MTPQAYPLVIRDENVDDWYVIGWLDYGHSQRPVVVPHHCETTTVTRAEVLDENMSWRVIDPA